MFCWAPSSVAVPYCICRQHYDIPYHGRWRQHGKPAAGTSGPVRTALFKQKGTNNRVVGLNTTEKFASQFHTWWGFVLAEMLTVQTFRWFCWIKGTKEKQMNIKSNPRSLCKEYDHPVSASSYLNWHWVNYIRINTGASTARMSVRLLKHCFKPVTV